MSHALPCFGSSSPKLPRIHFGLHWHENTKVIFNKTIHTQIKMGKSGFAGNSICLDCAQFLFCSRTQSRTRNKWAVVSVPAWHAFFSMDFRARERLLAAYHLVEMEPKLNIIVHILAIQLKLFVLWNTSQSWSLFHWMFEIVKKEIF